MSVKVMSWAWELDLPPNIKLVLLAYADHAHDDGTNARPSIRRVARKSGYSTRQVQRIVAELVRNGVMVLVAEGRGHRPADYRIMVDYPLTVPRDEWSASSASPEFRAEVIERFDRQCYWCRLPGGSDDGPDGNRWEVDRLVAGRAGGTYTSENVVLSCRTCNRKGGVNLSPPQGASSATRGASGGAQRGDTGDALTIRNHQGTADSASCEQCHGTGWYVPDTDDRHQPARKCDHRIGALAGGTPIPEGH